MGNVGGERRQALEGVVETPEHGVEMVGHFRQFRRHVFFRQACVERLRRDTAGDCAHAA